MTHRQALPAAPTARPVLAPVANGAPRAPDGAIARPDATTAAHGADAAPDLAACVASLAGAAAHLASHAQQLAELLAGHAGTPTSSLALLARHEPCHDSMDPTAEPAKILGMPLMLTKRQAAELLGVHPRTMDRMRAAGEGPKALRVRDAVRYRRRDVERWLEGKR